MSALASMCIVQCIVDTMCAALFRSFHFCLEIDFKYGKKLFWAAKKVAYTVPCTVYTVHCTHYPVQCTMYTVNSVQCSRLLHSELYKKDQAEKLCSEDCSKFRGCCCSHCHCCSNCTASCSCPFSTREPDSVIQNLLALTSGYYRWRRRQLDTFVDT